VGFIIPRHVTRDFVHKDLRLLWDEGLYRPFYPEEFVNDSAFAKERDTLFSEFFAVQKSDAFHRMLKLWYGRDFTATDYQHVFSPAAIRERTEGFEQQLDQAKHQRQTVVNAKVVAELLMELSRLKVGVEDVAFVKQLVIQPTDVVLWEPLTAALYGLACEVSG
jgi:hypothetical protein